MNTEALAKELPPKTNRFSVKVTGNVTNTEFEGSFTFRIPNVRTTAQISLMEARLNEGLSDSLDASTLATHYMIAYLRYSLVENKEEGEVYPKWWKESNYGYELYDANVITAIYNKCLEYEKEWREQVFGAKEAN